MRPEQLARVARHTCIEAQASNAQICRDEARGEIIDLNISRAHMLDVMSAFTNTFPSSSYDRISPLFPLVVRDVGKVATQFHVTLQVDTDASTGAYQSGAYIAHYRVDSRQGEIRKNTKGANVRVVSYGYEYVPDELSITTTIPKVIGAYALALGEIEGTVSLLLAQHPDMCQQLRHLYVSDLPQIESS